MLNNILIVTLLALSLTIVIEVFVAVLLKFTGEKKLVIVALASVVTNPLLSFLISIWFFLTERELAFYSILLLEIMVVMVEYYILSYVYGKTERKTRLFFLSFSMNTASYVIGLIVFDQIVGFFLG